MPNGEQRIIVYRGQQIPVPAEWSKAQVSIWLQSGMKPEQNPAMTRTGPRGLPVLREPSPSTLPVVGGMMGSVLGPAGVVGGAAAAGLGASAGQAVSQIERRITGQQAPETSGEAAEEIIEEGAIQGGLELAGRGIARGITGVVNKIFSGLPKKQAIKLMADEISSDAVSPAQAGKMIQQGFDEMLDMAGKAKGAVVDDISRTFTQKIRPAKSLAIFDQEIAHLEKSIKEGRLSKEMGGKAEALLDFLKKRRDSFGFPQSLKELDAARTDFFKAAKEIDPSEGSRVSKRLSHAVHEDIVSGLPKEQAERYAAASSRFREIIELREEDVLKRIFSEGRVAPGKVMSIIQQDPESAIRAIRIINKEGDRIGLQTVKRAFFDHITRKGALPSTDDNLIREVFGKDAEKVIKFGELLTESGKETFWNKVLGFVRTPLPGRAGSIAFTDPAGNVILIEPSKMAKILENPAGLRAAMDAIESPINRQGQILSKRGLNAARSLVLVMQAVERRTKEEDEQKRSSATIRERMVAKGQKPEQLFGSVRQF